MALTWEDEIGRLDSSAPPATVTYVYVKRPNPSNPITKKNRNIQLSKYVQQEPITTSTLCIFLFPTTTYAYFQSLSVNIMNPFHPTSGNKLPQAGDSGSRVPREGIPIPRLEPTSPYLSSMRLSSSETSLSSIESTIMILDAAIAISSDVMTTPTTGTRKKTSSSSLSSLEDGKPRQ
mmetsp:Transcript_4750/g.8833  ORF Transcript_4750/g.8833 Transcript_4750/m.8833 type:complete len:177 (-) Transcript_4750:277-807(-)